MGIILEYVWPALISAGILGLPVYFLRERIVTQLTSSVKHKYDAKLEDLRTELRILSFGKEKRFATYHNRQFEVIEELYVELQKLYLASKSYTSPSTWTHNVDELHKDVFNKYWAVQEVYLIRKLFIPGKIRIAIEAFQKKVWETIVKFRVHVEDPMKRQEVGGTYRVDHEQWQKASEMIEKEVEPILELIDLEFQKIIRADIPDLKVTK